MKLTERISQFGIILLLLIQLVIGTPFTISVADEIIEATNPIENLESNENSIWVEPSTETFPLTEVIIQEDNTTITYTESENNNEILLTTDTEETNVETTIIEEIVNWNNNTWDNNNVISENQEINITSWDIEDIISWNVENNFISWDNKDSNNEIIIENWFVNNDTIEINQPSLVTTKPQKLINIVNWLIDPLSIDSFNVIDTNNDITFCSYVTYLNLKYLTNWDDDTFIRGNAIDIWTKLSLDTIVEWKSEVIFTWTNLSWSLFIDYLSWQFSLSWSTVFDIVTFKPKSVNDTSTWLSLHQSHRFVIFFWSDNNRYTIDPIRTSTLAPVLLNEYLENFIFNNEDIKIVQSYVHYIEKPIDDLIITHENTEQISNLIVKSPMEFLPYVLQWLITATKTGELISNEVIFHTGFHYETQSGDLSAYIPAGLIIKTADQEDFNVSSLKIQELSWNNISWYNDTFQFWISWQHLIFSKPIKLTILTPQYQTGEEINLLVQHEWQDWNTLWLTNNATAVCNNDGSVNLEDQINKTIVNNGTIEFYTCGASSFALGYVPELDSPNGSVLTINEQPDGKIIIGGTFTTVWWVTRSRIARLNSDKSLDTSFNPNSNNTLNDIELQPDGKIIIGGTFTTVWWVARNRIARLNSDWSLDTSFNPNSNNTLNDIELQPDGKIIIGWTFTTVGWVARNRIARLNSDWSLDTSFNPNSNGTIIDIEAQNDWKVIVWWAFTTIGWVARNYIARLNSDWSLDTSFNPNSNGTINDNRIQNDWKIIVWWAFTTIGWVARNRIARLNSDWSLDTSFNPNSNGTINSIEVEEDGKIIIGWAFTTVGWVTRNRIARLNSDWSLDTSFNPNSNSTISKVKLIWSKIWVWGAFTSINAIAQWYFSIIDNTVHDTVYNARPNSTVSALLKQADGKILLWGSFTTVWGISRNRVARFDSDWTLDINFNPNTNSTVSSFAIQTDGKILLWGWFTTVGWVARNYIARLNSDWSLDTSFNANISTSAQLNSIAIQPDGKIIIGGTFVTVGWVARSRIARLNSDWSLDTSFNPNASSNVNSIIVQPDWKIIVWWAFTTIGWVARNRIARLNSDWSLDTSFNPNSNSTIITIALQTDGKILLWGWFTTIGWVARNYIARLNSDWSLDTSFNPNSNSTVNTIYLLPDWSIIIGWLFTTMWGIARTEIAKVDNNGTLDTSFNVVFWWASTAIFALTQDNQSNIIAWGSFTTVNWWANNPYLAWIWTTETLNNIALWLRSDTWTNCNTHACTITSWNDQSSFWRNASVVNAAWWAVNYDFNNKINFNSTVLLNSSQLNFASPTSINNYTVFYVLRWNDISQWSALLEDSSTSMRFEQWWNTNRYWYTRYWVSDHTSNVTTQWNQYQILRYNSANTTTIDLSVQTPSTKLQQIWWNIWSVSNLWIWRFSSVGNEKWIFNIWEILAYAWQLSSINLNKVESYLATKYWFTLDQSVVWWQNYTLTNGITSWSTWSAWIYNKDIAGIARDDGMNLLQMKSQTINNSWDIIVGSTWSIENYWSLLRANNWLNTWWSTSEVPPLINSRINREWKFQEKNWDIWNVTITYPISNTILPAWEIVMIKDDDWDFGNWWSSIISWQVIWSYRTFYDNISDNEYITFWLKKNIIPWCVNREPWAWYKADDNNYSSVSWIDQTTNHRDLDSNWTFFNDPYKTLVNFNPSYDFDSSNYFYYKWDIFTHDSDRWSMRYSVASYQKPVDQFWYLINFTVAGWATENASLLANNDVWRYHSYDTDNVGTTIDAFWTDPFKPKRRVLTSQRFKDDVAISEDWKELDRQSNWLNWSYYNHLSIGIQHEAWGNWKFPWFWQTPEVILYNDKHPDIDSYNINWDDDERIQTYLAIKYWQTLLHNYIDWYSNTIYDINLWYSSNIFWLWREACEWLYQKQSKSENNGSLVTMFVGSWVADFNEINTWVISNDNSYLIAWDNGWSYSTWSIYWAISWYTMIDRKRQTQNSNFIDNIGISAPSHLSSLSNKLAAPITWVVNLIIDNDWNFTDGNSSIYPMTLIGTEWIITWVNLTGIKYYTFASNWIKWDVCIEWPDTFNLWSWIAKSISWQLQSQSNYFKVDDQKGSLSWYYTTLSVSALTGANWITIPSSAIQIKADPIVTLSWTYNSSVFINPGITSYISASSPIQFIKRNANTWPYTVWTYWSKIWMRLNIPAYQSVWSYSGTITYTLYEN